MNDKILSSYELLCTELESVISTLEISITDINQDKTTDLVTVAINGLKYLVLEHTELSDRFFKEFSNEWIKSNTNTKYYLNYYMLVYSNPIIALWELYRAWYYPKNLQSGEKHWRSSKRVLRGIYFVLKQGLQLGGEYGDIFSWIWTGLIR